MTYSVFSIVANEISPSGCATYTYDLYSTNPYLRAPWYQYSEQLDDDYTTNGGTHPAYPFLTAVGGSYRITIFGYLGLRLQLDALNVWPSLPPQIPWLDYRTIYWQGHAIDAISNQTHTTISRLEKSIPNANATYFENPIPVTIGHNETKLYLGFNDTLTIFNRQYGLNKTILNNIAQCEPAVSETGFSPGQFPLSAVDGAASTKWQPQYDLMISDLIVRLPTPYVPVVGLYLDWGAEPARGFNVSFFNASNADEGFQYVEVYQDLNVSISHPYNMSEDALITLYVSNTTNVTLDTPVYSGDFARLLIWGNQNNTDQSTIDNSTLGVGATVAEFAVIAADDHKTVNATEDYGRPGEDMHIPDEEEKGQTDSKAAKYARSDRREEERMVMAVPFKFRSNAP